jgi:hypothetical protein
MTYTTLSQTNTNAFKHNYYGTISIIRNLLDKTKLDFNDENKTLATEKIFEHILANPNVLIYEPKFRNSIINRINDIEKVIAVRKIALKNAKYDEAFNMIKKSINTHISHSEIRDKIDNNLNKITKLINNYNTWVDRQSLIVTMNSLKTLLEELKNDPNYVE